MKYLTHLKDRCRHSLAVLVGVLILQQGIAQTIVERHGRMQAANDGTSHFKGARSGEVMYPAGASLFWSGDGTAYYNRQTIARLKSQYNCQIIRSAMAVNSPWGGGYVTDPNRFQAHTEAVVDAAIAEGMYVIIDFHIEGDCSPYVEQAKTFFRTMAQKYGTYDNVIYELWNEPTEQTWNAKIRPYCVAVINEIRKYDPDNLILCGTQTWSQKVEDAAANPISDANVGYVLHFYSDLHGPWLYNGKQNLGVPVFVTEWGTPGYNGNTEGFRAWMEANKIPNCSWAVNNKDEALSYFTPGNSNYTGPWTDADLRDAGKVLTGITKAWSGNSVSPTPTCTAINLPAKFEAESYCNMSGVQTETCSEGGLNVGYIDAADWMSYKVTVPTAGTYTFTYRVASANGGGVIQLDRDAGATVLGTVNVAATGGWQTWTSVSHNVTLTAGTYEIGIKAITGGFNLNWVQATSSTTGFSVFREAEQYSEMSGVQTESTTDAGGGLNVGWIDTNDWLKYKTINIPSTGAYVFEFRVASPNSTGVLSQDLNSGAIQLGTINVPNTGGWQNWQTITRTVTLNAGTYDFGIFAATGGWNLNWWRVSSAASGATLAASATAVGEPAAAVASAEVYPNPSNGAVTIQVDRPAAVRIRNLNGKLVYTANASGTLVVNDLPTGYYIVEIESNGSLHRQKLMVRP